MTNSALIPLDSGLLIDIPLGNMGGAESTPAVIEPIPVPTDLARNLMWRWALMEVEDQETQTAIWKWCARDPIFFVNSMVWTLDPRLSDNKVNPFILYPHQADAFLKLIECIKNGEDVVIEKSRDQGASWMCLILFLWMWLFKPHCQFICVSKDEDSVDEYDNTDSLFPKIDHMMSYLPQWMLPLGWDENKHRKKFMFVNPENESAIKGVASTGEAGVGSRATAMFIDEFSTIKDGEQILSRTTNTSECRIFNGTHRGLGNAFYKICDTETSGYRKIILHWTMHPVQNRGMYRWDDENNCIEVLDKTYRFPADYRFIRDGSPTGGYAPGIRSPWYDYQSKRKGSEEEVARELDIDPVRSSSQFFEPAIIYELIKRYTRRPDLRLTFDYDEIKGTPRGLLTDEVGELKLWTDIEGGRPREGFYAMGLDISFGTGATPSTASIVECHTGEKIGEFASALMKPEDFAVYMVALCRLFRSPTGDPAWMAWEYHGPGATFSAKALELGFFNFLRREVSTGLFSTTSDRPGWSNQGVAKEQLLSDYRSALKSRLFVNRSESALLECLLYGRNSAGKLTHGSKKGSGDGGASQNHGDMAIADALAWRMTKYLGYGENPELSDDKPQEMMQPITGLGTFRARMSAWEETERRKSEYARWD